VLPTRQDRFREAPISPVGILDLRQIAESVSERRLGSLQRDRRQAGNGATTIQSWRVQARSESVSLVEAKSLGNLRTNSSRRQIFSQGLKPALLLGHFGTLRLRSGRAIEVVPFQNVDLFRDSLVLQLYLRSLPEK